MNRHITGSVNTNHLRRPNVSMVRIAGRPKKKFIAPVIYTREKTVATKRLFSDIPNPKL